MKISAKEAKKININESQVEPDVKSHKKLVKKVLSANKISCKIYELLIYQDAMFDSIHLRR